MIFGASPSMFGLIFGLKKYILVHYPEISGIFWRNFRFNFWREKKENEKMMANLKLTWITIPNSNNWDAIIHIAPEKQTVIQNRKINGGKILWKKLC